MVKGVFLKIKIIKKLLYNFINKLIKKKKIDTVYIDHFYPAKKYKKQKTIPYNFFQTYKSYKVDNEFDLRFSKFRLENPEYNYYFFDDIEMDSYMEKNWSHRKIYQIYKDSIFGASKADIWRYCILYEYGGIYLDFDSSIEFNLNIIPDNAEEFISFEQNKVSSQITKEYTPDYEFLSNLPNKHKEIIHPENLIIQWLLIYKKNHPILMSVIEEIEKNYEFFLGRKFKSAHLAIVNFTAPVILTKVVWDYVLKNNKIYQTNIDFESKVTFKNFSKKGVYFNDSDYYKNYSNTEILLNNPIRLNLGCGNDVKSLYINIDAVKNHKDVLLIDINNLKKHFEDRTVQEIYAKDVLEHVGLPTAKKWVSDWSNLLKPGGILTITTTCLDLIVDAYKKKIINEEKLNYLLFAGVFWENGRSNWDDKKTTQYDWHKVCFSKNQLKDLLLNNGLIIISEKYDKIEKKNINGLNQTIKAKKIK